jgi:hypothetical protein
VRLSDAQRNTLRDPGSQAVVTIEKLRNELRDLPNFNEVSPRDLSDDELEEALVDAMIDFNERPPMDTWYGPVDFPDRRWLLDQAVINAVKKLVLWHARNQNSASDAGVQVPVHEQWKPLLDIMQIMKGENDQRVALKKAQINIKRGWGAGAGSPLIWR